MTRIIQNLNHFQDERHNDQRTCTHSHRANPPVCLLTSAHWIQSLRVSFSKLYLGNLGGDASHVCQVRLTGDQGDWKKEMEKENPKKNDIRISVWKKKVKVSPGFIPEETYRRPTYMYITYICIRCYLASCGSILYTSQQITNWDRDHTLVRIYNDDHTVVHYLPCIKQPQLHCGKLRGAKST